MNKGHGAGATVGSGDHGHHTARDLWTLCGSLVIPWVLPDLLDFPRKLINGIFM